MANETPISPLSLEAGAGLLQNTGIQLGSALTANVAAYEATTLISKLLNIQSLAATANISAPTLTSLQTMGASTVPALGDSVPTAYQNTSYPVPPSGGSPKLIPASSASLFGGIIENIGSGYLGSGDLGKFSQAYFASSGYISLVNPVILSAANANNYLGPTFTNMDNLITGDIAQVNLAFPALGEDLAALGFALNLANLDSVAAPIGSPAALLQALSQAGNMPNGTLPAVRNALNAVGVTDAEIRDLVTNNVYSLFNPAGLTEPEFNALQKRAYPALCEITGAELQEVLDILECTTANITQMCELLNPVKILPKSYLSLTLPTPSGPVLVYSPTGTVNGDIEPIVNSGMLAPVGCDELGKIVPPANAAGSKALQIALQQIKNVGSLTTPQLAAVLL